MFARLQPSLNVATVVARPTACRAWRSALGGVAAGLMLVATACGGSAPATPQQGAKAAATVPSTSAVPAVGGEEGDPADEVCADMTQTNVANQLSHGSVIGVPEKTKTGTDTTCIYRMTSGSLRLSVHVADSVSAARTYFATQRKSTERVDTVNNLGTDAFSRPDGSTFTIKDAMVLTVDVTKLPDGNDRLQIAQSLSFQILSCWTG